MNKSEFLGLNLPSRDNTTDIADINAISENFETIDGALLDLVEKQMPKLQTKENINLNFDDNSTNEEQYPSVPAVVNFTNRKVDPLKIINSASGNAIALKDSAKYKLKGLKLFGKTTQDGTPTPTEPIELKSIGDSGSYSVDVYGKNLLEITAITQTVDGVTITVNADKSVTYKGTATKTFNSPLSSSFYIPKGKYKMLGGTWNIELIIPNQSAKYYTSQTFEVTEDGCRIYPYKSFTNGNAYDSTIYPMLVLESVTDETYEPYKAKQSLTFTDTLRGVGEVKDEKDFARGVTTKRFEKVVFNGSEVWAQQSIPNLPNCIGVYISKSYFPNAKTQSGCINGYMCDSFKTAFSGTAGTEPNICSWNTHGTNFLINAEKEICGETLDSFKTWLASNPVTVIYETEPIETPISESELNAYRQLYTNKGNTTVLSEADMEIFYVADPKLYIDNKIAELTALTLEG